MALAPEAAWARLDSHPSPAASDRHNTFSRVKEVADISGDENCSPAVACSEVTLAATPARGLHGIISVKVGS